jgi:hypothetical protein
MKWGLNPSTALAEAANDGNWDTTALGDPTALAAAQSG